MFNIKFTSFIIVNSIYILIKKALVFIEIKQIFNY